MDYTNFLVRNCPKTAIYIPNFITTEEEQRILLQIDRAPKPKWTQLSRRRLINYGGIPHPNGMIAEEIPKWLQLFIDKINNLGILESKANHVLVNEYLPGQGIMPHTDGPMFHPIICTISCGSHTILEFYKNNDDNRKDNQLYEISAPITQNIENQNQEENNCSKNDCDDGYKLLIEPRSLLILKDSMYKDYLHAIAEKTEDTVCDAVCNLENCENPYKFGDKIKRHKRISLTIRHVPKTTKLKLKFSTQ